MAHPEHQETPKGRTPRKIPRLPVFLGTLALALGAFFAPGWIGAVLVGLLAAGVAVMVVPTWNQQPVAARVLRLAVLGVLVVIAVDKVM